MNLSRIAGLLAIGLVPLATAAAAQTAVPPADGQVAPAETAAPSAPATAPADAASAPDSGAATGAAPSADGTAALTLPNGADMTPDHMENGRWYTKDGIPTFKIENGELDYASFSGYRRYHAECHVCHGPDGEGSTYAPALKQSVLTMDYYAFQEIVASGKQSTGTGSANQVMPAFGTNRNVWCYVDDIYAYLVAHGTGAIPRGRPAQKAKKSDEFAAQEASCMDG